MEPVVALLANQPLLLLFVVIGIGYVAGSVRIFGFSLGPAAILFAGLILGAFDSRLRLPDLVYIFGLILFVYTIGLQSGPTFFSSFGKRSFRANCFAFLLIAIAAVISLIGARVLDLAPSSVAGVFCGALTNTPALAASVETIRSVLGGQGVSPDDLAAAVNAPVIGYGVSYPFGVIGVLFGFHLFGLAWKRFRFPDRTPDEGGRAEGQGAIRAMTFRVVNPGIAGQSVAKILELNPDAGFVLSRMRRGEHQALVSGELILEQGDLVVAVGNPLALDRARSIFGEESPEQIHTENSEFDYRRIEVSEGTVVGKSVSSLRLQETLDATITRIRRGDVDFVPSGSTVLERGDRVRVVTWAGNMERIARYFGDSIRSGTEMDFLSLSIGIVGGVLLGMVPIPLPGGGSFSLGFAGGPLVAGLLLGRLGRSGSVAWGMPYAVNLTLRQVGLALFLAGIGTKAGGGFVATLVAGGWKLMLLGGIITVTLTAVSMIAGAKLLRLNYPSAMGLMSGIQTQPACLAYASRETGSNLPNVWYATVYPVSMIAKILCAQILISHLF